MQCTPLHGISGIRHTWAAAGTALLASSFPRASCRAGAQLEAG